MHACERDRQNAELSPAEACCGSACCVSAPAGPVTPARPARRSRVRHALRHADFDQIAAAIAAVGYRAAPAQE